MALGRRDEDLVVTLLGDGGGPLGNLALLVAHEVAALREDQRVQVEHLLGDLREVVLGELLQCVAVRVRAALLLGELGRLLLDIPDVLVVRVDLELDLVEALDDVLAVVLADALHDAVLVLLRLA